MKKAILIAVAALLSAQASTADGPFFSPKFYGYVGLGLSGWMFAESIRQMKKIGEDVEAVVTALGQGVRAAGIVDAGALADFFLTFTEIFDYHNPAFSSGEGFESALYGNIRLPQHVAKLV